MTPGGLRVIFAFVFAAAVLAQDPRGAIVGQVSDTTGAVVPGVAVRATNLETKVTVSATSNEQGNYEIPYLLPGAYAIAAELAGFKGWSRPRVELRMGDRLRIDIALEVGNVTESVEVTAQAPVLESTSASIGQVISSRQIADLPLRSGNVAWLFSMAPGVILQMLPFDGPWNIEQAASLSVAGAGPRSFDFNVDGVSNNSYGGRTAFVPPADMVQEVRIDTASYDAAVGHTTGGAINISLKAGTNALHGTLGAAVSSGPMMTRNFFTNKFIFDPTTGPITPEKIKANTPSLRWLRYSAAVGGPVYLPKLYDGRAKTFWMFGYQTHNRRRPNATVHTVPTPAQRTGDFSALLALGSQYQIYDPLTTTPSGATRFARQPLAGNRIPASRLDATAQKILRYFPAPNTAGTADGLNNYARTRQDTQDLYQPIARVDHNFSEARRMFARYSHSDFYGHFDQLIAGSSVRGRQRRRPHRGVALDNVFVLSPRTVLDVRYGFTWFQEFQSFDNMGWNLSEFGFPASLIRELDPAGISFPVINVTGLLQLGNDGGFKRVNDSHSLLTVLSWMRGNHSVKAGFDGRLLFETNQEYGNVAPRLDFAQAYTRGPLDNSPVAPAGQGLASFLLGIPTGGWVDLNDSRAEFSQFYAGFLQDDWRVTKKLTLNLGLRWECESPVTERFNRTTRDFDFRSVNPIQARAQAQYARAPILEVPASEFRTVGGVTFAGLGGQPRGIRDPYRRALMPRLGFAYQLARQVVVRGGYGIYFDMLGAEFSDVSQPGFNQRTNVLASLDNGQTYVASIANPLPSGLEQPKGAAGGLETYLGRSPGFFAATGVRPYIQRWSYSIQYEPAQQMLFELGYIGTRAVRQRVSTEFNPVPRRYLSTSPARDQATIDYLSARVANPFVGLAGFAGSALFAAANTTRSQLLQPYPHFSGLSAGLPAGASWYHALMARFERRFSRGLQAQASYTWSKTMRAVDYLNATDNIPEHVVCMFDRPHRLAMTAMYELPFGAGRRWGGAARGLLNHLIGGWQVQAIYQAQSGPPLEFGNVIYRGTYRDLRLSGDQQTLDGWFNTAGFERNPNLQLANNIRTFPTRVAAARADGINVWDLAAHKTFRLMEKLKLQLRGEAEGAMNHPNFEAPNAAPTSTLFGCVTVTQTGQEERRIFVGLKLLF